MSTPCWQPNTAKKRDELSAEVGVKASRGFEPRSLDSESRVLTVTPRGQVHMSVAVGEVSQGLECSSMHEHALLAAQYR